MFWNIIAEAVAETKTVCWNIDVFEIGVAADAMAEVEAVNEVVERSLELKLQSKL